jgi:transcriptional regulator with XRE-family HTH domain
MMIDNSNGAGLTIPPPGEERREWIRYRLRKLKGPKGKRLTSADIARTTGAGESTVSLVFLGRRVDGDKAAAVREHTAKLLEIPEEILFPEILTINAAHAVACPKCGHEFEPDNPLASLLPAVDAGEQESGQDAERLESALDRVNEENARTAAELDEREEPSGAPRFEEFEDLDDAAQGEVRALENADDSAPTFRTGAADRAILSGSGEPEEEEEEEEEEPQDTCIACDGSGHDQENDGRLCRVCHGSGEVPVGSPHGASTALPSEPA